MSLKSISRRLPLISSSLVKSSISSQQHITPIYNSPIYNTAYSHMFANKLVTISSSLVDGLKKHQIFPDVLDPFIPRGLLTISYGKNKDVILGNKLSVEETQEFPKVQFTINMEDNSSVDIFSASDMFTLVLTDPDAPSKNDKKWSEYCHFIQTNIKLNPTEKEGDDRKKGLENGFIYGMLDLSKPALVEYEGPAPPEKTGLHRYVFVLFRQKAEINAPAPKERKNWGYGEPATGVKKWASSLNLEPVAASFFYAQNSVQ